MNLRAFNEWYADANNRELFDTHAIPLICEANGCIIGGMPKLMYKPWSFELARSWNDAGVDDRLLIWDRIPKGEPNEGELFYTIDWNMLAHVLTVYVKACRIARERYSSFG